MSPLALLVPIVAGGGAALHLDILGKKGGSCEIFLKKMKTAMVRKGMSIMRIQFRSIYYCYRGLLDPGSQFSLMLWAVLGM